jgi:hypothetical protein
MTVGTGAQHLHLLTPDVTSSFRFLFLFEKSTVTVGKNKSKNQWGTLRL